MKKYTVYFTIAVGRSVEIEAEDAESAYDIVANGDHDISKEIEGDTADEPIGINVYDENGNLVYTD